MCHITHKYDGTFRYLKAEMHTAESLWFGLLLEAYAGGCGEYLDELKRQTDMLKYWTEVADSAKTVKKNREGRGGEEPKRHLLNVVFFR